MHCIVKIQVVKVSPGGSLPGGEGGEASHPGGEEGEGHVILGFSIPTTSELKQSSMTMNSG